MYVPSPHLTSQTFLRYICSYDFSALRKNPKLIPQFIKLCVKGSMSLCEEKLLYLHSLVVGTTEEKD
jgi:hypothetical protein